MKIRDKIVLITGGASGIGKIMGRKALERDCKKLVVWDVNQDALYQVAQEWTHYKNKLILRQVDLLDLHALLDAASEMLSTEGAPDILINNAGIVVGKYFHEHTHTDIERTMGINTNAVQHLTLAFLPHMMARNSGAICTVASSAGLIGNPKMAVYAASKWAANGWSESLRLEMEQLGCAITVTTVMPFYINTGMFEGVRSTVLPILQPERVAEKVLIAIERERKILALPLPYHFIRFAQGILPLNIFDWVMRRVFRIYDTMRDFKGRE